MSIAGSAQCTLGKHEEINAVDARTTTEILCRAISRRGGEGAYDVRLGKLGGKILLSVDRKDGEHRDALIQSLEEVPVAADRLAEAMTSRKRVAETEKADNVLREEAKPVVLKAGQISGNMGITGLSPLKDAAGSGGAYAGLGYRSGGWAAVGNGRLGGVGDRGSLSYLQFDAGGRYYLSDDSFSLFGGTGLSVGKMSVAPNGYGDSPIGTVFSAVFGGKEKGIAGGGVGAYGEVGAEMFRGNRVGAMVSMRLDAPFYALRTAPGYDYPSSYSYSYSGYQAPKQRAIEERYVLPLSLNVGMTFH